MKHIEYFLQKQVFGVCSLLGERMGIETTKIRMFFIYLSFLTFGSPVIIYLILAFWVDLWNFFLYRKFRTIKAL
ncbi:MAG: PspC domain-containing protein [Bacteroidetes bacterium]|nr:PspC domain-containing protein [Bacteroidota bacterium]